MSYTSAFTPEAQEQQLLELYRYIAAAASPVIAERYTNAIIRTAKSCGRFRIGAIAGMTFAKACASRITASG
jgi:plasmid stabilization system protein ParE